MLALWLAALLLADHPARRFPAQHDFEIRCLGLESYDIRASTDVDWSWGTFRSKRDSYAVGFTGGDMVAVQVPKGRPPGFRWVKEEKIGSVVLRYGLNVRTKKLEATMSGAKLSDLLNLVAQPASETRFLELARAIAVAPCQWRRLPDPP
jgi:hypothetical protein